MAMPAERFATKFVKDDGCWSWHLLHLQGLAGVPHLSHSCPAEIPAQEERLKTVAPRR
jgi:hypothetical protein